MKDDFMDKLLKSMDRLNTKYILYCNHGKFEETKHAIYSDDFLSERITVKAVKSDVLEDKFILVREDLFNFF